MEKFRERISAKGHKNIMAKHRTTLMITKDDYLTPRGDCIVAISASKAVKDLSPEIKDALKKENSIMEMIITCNGVQDKIIAHGNPSLMLTHERDIVVRKSNFICPRTLAIKANKAAIDLKRELVSQLKSGEKCQIDIIVKIP